MKKRIRYTDHDLGKNRIVKNDFLPRPEDLVLREDNVKVTINLTRTSLDFFKKAGKKNRTPYQKVIRNLLDFYAARAA